MTASVMSEYDNLTSHNRSLVDDFISMLSLREKEDETLQVIRDARNGIGLSETYDNVEDLMKALNA